MKRTNLALGFILATLLVLLIGTLSKISAQTSNVYGNYTESNVQYDEDGRSIVLLTYSAKEHEKALKTLINKGIASRQHSKVNIQTPAAKMFFTVTPILHEGSVEYFVHYGSDKDPVYNSTKISDVRNEVLRLAILYLDNI